MWIVASSRTKWCRWEMSFSRLALAARNRRPNCRVCSPSQESRHVYCSRWCFQSLQIPSATLICWCRFLRMPAMPFSPQSMEFLRVWESDVVGLQLACKRDYWWWGQKANLLVAKMMNVVTTARIRLIVATTSVLYHLKNNEAIWGNSGQRRPDELVGSPRIHCFIVPCIEAVKVSIPMTLKNVIIRSHGIMSSQFLLLRN